MSFLNRNCRTDRTPGRISGNPLNGLCEKVCIEVKKVFDACMKQEAITDLSVTITDITPAGTVEPYTFLSARSINSHSIISNLIVTPLDDGACSRVSATITIPIEVLFTDANGITASGSSTVTLTRDVVLSTPQPSVMPYEVEAITNLIAPEGEYLGNNVFSITGCITGILKIVMEVELLVPSYGYCQIPTCQDYKADVCDGFFDLPLYPR